MATLSLLDFEPAMSQVLRWNAEKYPPLGHCVYCRAGGELSDEHIIPFALQPKGGDWFLPKASCPACADITKRFETTVLRGMFGPLRQQMGLKTRKKKDGIVTVRFNYPDGRLIDKPMSIHDFPAVVSGFKWPAPGVLVGRPMHETLQSEFFTRISPMQAVARPDEAMRIARASPVEFARMLAKIAHVYAVAKFGEGAFEPMLLDFILGRSSTAPTYFVGGDLRPNLPEGDPNTLHEVHRLDAWRNHSELMFSVGIWLFGCFGMPRYHVIVGCRRDQVLTGKERADTVAVHLPIAGR